jgi:tetratricopeptide (TPR) repeat protein
MTKRSVCRLIPSTLALVGAIALASCTTASRKSTRGSATPDAYRTGSYTSRSIVSNGETLEAVAGRASYSRTRAEAFLDAARAYLNEARPADALRCSHEARHAYSDSRLVGRAYRLLGEAHLAAGQFTLAERYLRKGLKNASGTEKELTTARQVVTLRGLGRTPEASVLERQLRQRGSAQVRRILAMKTPAPISKPGSRFPKGKPVVKHRHDRVPAPDAFRLPRLQVLPRSVWNAKPVVRGRTKPLGTVRKVTIHHSAPRDDFVGTTRWAAANQINKIQRYHQKDRGWADIGYHYIIDRRGEVFQGRSLSYQGAHASGRANRGNIGIVVLGNYSARRQRLTDAQRRSLTVLTARLCDHYRIGAKQIYTHEEIRPGHTECPGPEISSYVSKIRQSITRRQIALATRKKTASPVAYHGK